MPRRADVAIGCAAALLNSDWRANCSWWKFVPPPLVLLPLRGKSPVRLHKRVLFSNGRLSYNLSFLLKKVFAAFNILEQNKLFYFIFRNHDTKSCVLCNSKISAKWKYVYYVMYCPYNDNNKQTIINLTLQYKRALFRQIIYYIQKILN
jgi:hypothetical protein